MNSWLTNTILLLIIIFLFIILSWVWPPDSPWAPWWRTDKNKARAMCRLGKIDKNDVIYDLGCGDATALIIAAKEFGARGVGIEIDPLRVFISKLRIKFNNLSKAIKIIRKNFFNEDLSPATVIFAYLVPRALERLKPKLLEELKQGTLLVSFRYKISLPLVSYDKKNDIFLYKIPGKKN